MKHLLSVLGPVCVTMTMAYGCSSSSNGGAAGPDGGSPDATYHGIPHPDAGPGGDDAGGEDSGACPTPVDEGNFMPPAYKHAKTARGACSSADIAGYDMACLNSASASQASCSSFKSAHAACLACLVSKSSDSTWGPLVSWSGVVSANVAGCIELTNPSDTACPQVLESSDECTHAACDSVCPVTADQATYSAWKMCAQTADAHACGKYATPANACDGGDDAAATAVCDLAQYPTFDDTFEAFAALFCGGGDAGTMPADGGASDTGAADTGAPDASPD